MIPQLICIQPIVMQNGAIAPATGVACLHDAITSLAGLKDSHFSTPDLRSAMRGILFVPVPQPSQDSGIVTHIEDAVASSTVAKSADYFLVPASAKPFKSAMELSLAIIHNRPIIGGVEDPSEEDVATHLEYEKRQRSDPISWLAGLYAKPFFFERSGKIYEYIGIRQFKWLVMNTIGRPFKLILKLVHPELKSASDADDMQEKRVARPRFKRKKERGASFDYWVGSKRTLERLRVYEQSTMYNELGHSVGAVLFTWPAVSAITHVIQEGREDLIWPAIKLGAVTVLNLYAALLQRYNRARTYNTIDLKLDRGEFTLNNRPIP